MNPYQSIQQKTRLVMSNISMETMFMTTENSKTNEPHKFGQQHGMRSLSSLTVLIQCEILKILSSVS